MIPILVYCVVDEDSSREIGADTKLRGNYDGQKLTPTEIANVRNRLEVVQLLEEHDS